MGTHCERSTTRSGIAIFSARRGIIKSNKWGEAFKPLSQWPQTGGLVQHGLSAAGGVDGFFEHFSAADKRQSLERTAMLIRPATPFDARFIGDIRVSAWKQAYREFMPAEFLEALDPSANLEALKSALQSNPQPFHMAVAEVDDACVGFSIIGRPRYQAPEPVTELWALNVHPTHWRGGVGSKLVSEAFSHARVKGFSAVELWCIEGNAPAARLYEKCGFKPTGERRTTSSLTGSPLTELAYQCAL